MNVYAESKINDIRQALQLNKQKQVNLRHSASQARGDISLSITRQLNALRDREVSLVNEVETVFMLNENDLKLEEAQLNETLGLGCVMSSGGHYPAGGHSSAGGAASLSTDHLIANSIQSLSLEENQQQQQTRGAAQTQIQGLYRSAGQGQTQSQTLGTGPGPSQAQGLYLITYTADETLVQNALNSFGHVHINKKMKLGDAFVDVSSQSQSLPKQYEDYNDDQHHILYKSIQEQTGSDVITVKIPKLQSKWLLKPNPQPQPGSSGIRTNAKSNPGVKCQDYCQWLSTASKPVSDWLMEEPSTTNRKPCTNSIHQWLCDIKMQTSMEEDDFEMLGSSSEGRSCFEKSNESECSPTSSTWPYLKWLHSTSNETWLDREGPLVCIPDDQCNVFAEHFTTIKDDQSSSKWLLSDAWVDSKSKKECARGCCLDRTSLEIEDLSMVQCVSRDVEAMHCECETLSGWLLMDQAGEESQQTITADGNGNPWLLHHGETTRVTPDPADLDPIVKVSQLCHANEVCESFSQCVCDANCAYPLANIENKPDMQHIDPLANRPSYEKWLYQKVRLSVNLANHYYDCISSESNQWLLDNQSQDQLGQDAIEKDLKKCEEGKIWSHDQANVRWLVPVVVGGGGATAVDVMSPGFQVEEPQPFLGNLRKNQLSCWLLGDKETKMEDNCEENKDLSTEKLENLWLLGHSQPQPATATKQWAGD